jgi:iron complex outermembrane receptor protein
MALAGLASAAFAAPAWSHDAKDTAAKAGDAAGAPLTDVPDKDDADRDKDIVVVGRGDVKSKAEAALATVAGGTALIDNAQVEKGGIISNADVLAFQPGVFARTASGSDGIKISIRGSSINRGANFFRSGILFTFDGLPVSGPGGTPYELFEPLGLDHTEILRGANAFDLGSSTLGGAINYVSKTGADASIFAGRLESGSYGYRKYQASSGGKYGSFDYYVSVTGAEREGYQAHSRGRNFGVAANVGIELTPSIETRFFGRYRQTSNQLPGSLTLAQIETNPRLANPINVADPSGLLSPTKQDPIRIQPGSYWLANKTTFDFGRQGTLSLGFVYHDYPIDARSTIRQVWGYSDLSGVLDYQRTDTLFGRDSHTTLGLVFTGHPKDAFQDTFVRIPTGVTAPYAVGTLERHAYYRGSDGNVHLSNDSQPFENFHLILGSSLVRVLRATGVTTPSIAGLTTPYHRETWHLAPRGGFLFEPSEALQFFGNVSRSIEPPNDWAILSTPPGIPNSFPGGGLAAHALDLKDQSAITYELGGRGVLPVIGRWSLSVYRANVRNELLTVEVVAASSTSAAITAESNASPTTHQGVEVGLDTTLWKPSDQQSLTLRQSYTFNDFKFRRDAKFGKNELPGIPKHVYQAQLSYNDPSGFYISGNTTVASKNYLDYSNSVSAKGYQIWGGTVGIDIPDTRYKLFVDFDNIFNKHYASVVSPVYDLKGSDTTNPRLTPGDGFTVIGGVSFGF